MLFDSLSKTLDEMRWSPHQRFTLEVGLIKACTIAQLRPLSEILGHMKELEGKLVFGGTLPALSTAKNRSSEQPASSTASKKASLPQSLLAPADAAKEHGDLWGMIIAAIREKKPGLASALGHGQIISVTDSEFVIGVTGSSFQVDLVGKRENKMLIEDLVAEIMSKKLSVKVQHVTSAEKQEFKAKSGKRTKPDEEDPAVQDVLRVFPTGEVIDLDHPLE